MRAYNDFFDEVVSTEIELWNHLDRALLAETGVSAAQLQALTALARPEGSARVQDVSQRLRITVGAASKLIDRLERDGLAERSPHPSDRRSMLIELTPAGETALAEATTAADSNLERLLGAQFEPAEAEAMTSALRALRLALTEGVLA
ncbi:MarR family transcriptional regulator [Herbiconiux sp. 11R-BC]|uniref:MarR family winged helix-turn-helix transcriptional regulator n=1 Tax=Herbiconiux sp. 11R-BC TaxID=3111637 RepID=UPI003C0093F0